MLADPLTAAFSTAAVTLLGCCYPRADGRKWHTSPGHGPSGFRAGLTSRGFARFGQRREPA